MPSSEHDDLQKAKAARASEQHRRHPPPPPPRRGQRSDDGSQKTGVATPNPGNLRNPGSPAREEGGGGGEVVSRAAESHPPSQPRRGPIIINLDDKNCFTEEVTI